MIASPSTTPSAADDDEPGIAGGVFRRRLLVECRANRPQLVLVSSGAETADEVAEPAARDMDVEEVRRAVPGDRERVHDLGRDEDPRLRARPMLSVLEPERELSVEDEERLRMSLVDVERRSDTTRCRANLRDADLLEIGEKRHTELPLARDALAVHDRDHRPAA